MLNCCCISSTSHIALVHFVLGVSGFQLYAFFAHTFKTSMNFLHDDLILGITAFCVSSTLSASTKYERLSTISMLSLSKFIVLSATAFKSPGMHFLPIKSFSVYALVITVRMRCNDNDKKLFEASYNEAL